MPSLRGCHRNRPTGASPVSRKTSPSSDDVEVDDSPLALDSENAAKHLGISRVLLDREKRAGKICPKYVGTKPIYPIGELQRWLDALPSEPPSRG